MGLIAELRLRDPELFAETFAEVPGADCVFEDVHYVTDSEGYTHYVFFWWVSGCDFEAFEEALEADPTVREGDCVTDIDDRRLYRLTTRRFPPGRSLVFPLFREHDVTSIASRRDADGLHLQARFPDRDALRSFLDDATDLARVIEVVQLYTENPATPPEAALTRKQREALSLAFERGYFETPSRTTLEELAGELDVTPQTLSRHVRVGVKKLVESAVSSPTGSSQPSDT